MTYLLHQPIDVAGLTASVAAANQGGVASFIGMVRNHHAGRAVVELEYSAYQPMADAAIREIVTETEGRWPVAVAVRHRLGRLAIGDAAVAVVVAGSHRAEVFEACRFVIEEIKRRVPIWKRERYADGSEAWVDPTAESRAS